MNDFKLTPSRTGELVTQLTKLMLDTGKTYRVSVKEWRGSRSLSQNALMWKWLDEINKQAQLTCDAKISGSEMWHEVFKKYYCPVKTIKNQHSEMQIKSTKSLDVGEMHFYLNKIECFCIDRGIKLTIPQDSEYAKLTERQEQ